MISISKKSNQMNSTSFQKNKHSKENENGEQYNNKKLNSISKGKPLIFELKSVKILVKEDTELGLIRITSTLNLFFHK